MTFLRNLCNTSNTTRIQNDWKKKKKKKKFVSCIKKTRQLNQIQLEDHLHSSNIINSSLTSTTRTTHTPYIVSLSSSSIIINLYNKNNSQCWLFESPLRMVGENDEEIIASQQSDLQNLPHSRKQISKVNKSTQWDTLLIDRRY